MTQTIDKSFWLDSLNKTDWYLILTEDFKRIEDLAVHEPNLEKRKQIKREAYELVEESIKAERIPLAKTGPNLDDQRKKIDTIVIHHTKNQPGMSLNRLNAIQLLRIYGRYFANPTDKREKSLKGNAIWSGHFYNGKQVFWGYHWLIREDGQSNHILNDSYIGWHAGNWDINTRSIGICIDDDLSSKIPSDIVLTAISSVIKKYYANINPKKVIGHCDVNYKTICPGNLFHKSWQEKLLLKL